MDLRDISGLVQLDVQDSGPACKLCAARCILYWPDRGDPNEELEQRCVVGTARVYLDNDKGPRINSKVAIRSVGTALCCFPAEECGLRPGGPLNGSYRPYKPTTP